MFYLTASIISKSVMPDNYDMRNREGEYSRYFIARYKILSACKQECGKSPYIRWDFESNDELKKILANFQMLKYLEFTTMPLVPQPVGMYK